MAAKKLSEQKLVSVFSTLDVMEAQLVQDLLRTSGIESTINAKVAPGTFPSTMGDLARQEVLVLESEAPDAKRIIAEQQEAGRKPAA